MPDSAAPGPADTYEQRSRSFAGDAERYGVVGRRLSVARVLAFVLLIGLATWADERPSPLQLLLACAAAAAFVALVALHRRTRRREARLRMLADLNAEGLHRLAREWDLLPSRECASHDTATHPYAADLDLFGPASLIQLLGPRGSPVGAATLDRWLLSPADPPTISARQEAVRELAGMRDLRDALSLHARATADGRLADLDRFLRWAEGPRWLTGRPAIAWLAWLLPLLAWTLLVLEATGVLGAPLWGVPLLLALVLTLTLGKRVRRSLREAAPLQRAFGDYSAMLALVGDASFEARLLRDLQREIRGSTTAADRELARLARLHHLADLQPRNLLYFPVQLLTLWDFHVLMRLERWQARAGGQARGWFGALGEAEALSALATLAHDHPDWTFPSFALGADPVLEADLVGHPLLAQAKRVDNDVRVGPPGTFLLVTGSNMSGKSTLLRAVGMNVVLAQAGAPVCARRMRLPAVDLHTVMRVDDSLARGVSYFMAELQRLKGVVEVADRLAGDDGRTLLYLFDEILRGTNSAERRTAAQHVISHLMRVGAIGAVTTHDLDLADAPSLRGAAELVHFEERILGEGRGAEITFDYRLRRGLATSTNALALMRLVGLPADPGDETGARRQLRRGGREQRR
ncbi:MAG TPA: hypothetical protein VHG51_04090 [Longimicrobiaceae bacterium]|nr:hypothetical protein [Longimicrobiaceae bacterium]